MVKAAGYTLQAAGYVVQAAGYMMQAAGYTLQAAGYLQLQHRAGMSMGREGSKHQTMETANTSNTFVIITGGR